jgi:hypothetical protein
MNDEQQFTPTGDSDVDALMHEEGFKNVREVLAALSATPTFHDDPQMCALMASYKVEAELFHAANALELPYVTQGVCKELESLSDLYKDTRGFNMVSPSTSKQRYGVPIDPISDSLREKLVKQAYHVFWRDPLARNIIRSYVHLTVGGGIQVRFVGKDAKRAQERWNIIAKCNNWELKYRDYLALSYLLGEWFLLRSPRVNNDFWGKGKPRSDRAKVLKKLQSTPPEDIVISSISPLEISDILCSKGNREIPMYYAVAQGDSVADVLDAEKAGVHGNQWPRGFWADDVTHMCVDDLLGGRGSSILAPVLKHLSYYRLFQLDRVTLNAIRARIPLIRKVTGGSARKSALRTAMDTDKLPHPGTIFIVDKDEQWDFPSTPQDGASANRDGRAILLMISAGVTLPEFMVSGDAGGANYASQLVASSPMVSMFKFLRERFGIQLCQLIEEVVGDEPEIIFPEIIVEDVLKVVQANSILYRDGVLSRATYSARCGLEYEVEQQARKADEESDPHSLYPDQRKKPGEFDVDHTGATPPATPSVAGGNKGIILPGAAIGQARKDSE